MQESGANTDIDVVAIVPVTVWIKLESRKEANRRFCESPEHPSIHHLIRELVFSKEMTQVLVIVRDYIALTLARNSSSSRFGGDHTSILWRIAATRLSALPYATSTR